MPQRSWYRRLLRKDFSIFREQLELWGEETDAAKVGTLGLIHSVDSSFGLASFYEGGWLHQGPSGDADPLQRSYSRRALLPVEQQIIDALGITVEEYWDFAV